MKKIFKLNLLVVLLLSSASCDVGFDELNENKMQALSIDPAFILNRATLALAYNTGTATYEMGIVQQIISPNSGVLTGANFNLDYRPSTVLNWQNYYRNVIKNTKDVIAATQNDPARANLYQMARIIQAYSFMVLTDSYGDIPYTEGGGGYTEQIFYPVYESQEDIYPKLIQEFSEASAALDAAALKVETAEILYNGNIAKWKKFGYSLLLRAGMRLSKANAALAQSTVSAAFAGGVITDNADNASIKHDANYQNPNGVMLNSTEAANFYLTKPFVDALKSRNDPRLPAIAVRYKGANSGAAQVDAVRSSLVADQIGLPMGKDNLTAFTAAQADGLVHYYDYSQLDRKRQVKVTAPNFIVTAAQCNLLLAEARHLNWIATGTVDGYFKTGIVAHMNQLGLVDAGSTITGTDSNAYGDARVAVLTGNELQEINYEYWVASLLNGPEAFANFRRSGFPALTPNPFVGAIPAGTFINRLTYPSSEISVNEANVKAAIQAQGMGGTSGLADDLATKVWWAQ